LISAFTANVSADLKIGDLQETIPVSSATPVIDVRNVIQQRVMPRDVIGGV